MEVDTYATNPADATLQISQFLRFERSGLIFVFLFLLIILGPLAWFFSKWFLLGMVLWLVYGVFCFVGTSRLLKLGNVCAAKVLSVDPGLVAVYADMTMDEDACFPAVVIKEQQVKSLSGEAVKVGDRLAVSAFYEGEVTATSNRWDGLSVIQPIRAVTADAKAIQRTMQSIDTEDWAALDEGLKTVANLQEEGVHFVVGAQSGSTQGSGTQPGGSGVAEGRVMLVPGDDAGMKMAAKLARKTFRYFMREWSWESRRIIPGLDFAAVKVAFSDPPEVKNPDPNALEVEYMWVSDVSFDGKRLKGTLLNQPDTLLSFKEGDPIDVSPKKIVDWMYSVLGEVCGGFSVQQMRIAMSKKELKQHDNAWGMSFGTPGGVRLVPESYMPEQGKTQKTKIPELEGMFIHGSIRQLDAMEHPMSVNMRDSLDEQLREDGSFLHSLDDDGFTILHGLALAGSLDGVDVCLDRGADPNTKAKNGVTPLILAKQLGWKKVVKRLEEASQ